MSRSRKKHPAGKLNLGSKRRGKQLSHRLFRQRERMAMITDEASMIPFHQWQVVDPWDLTDGRMYFGDRCKVDEYYKQLMRK